MEEIEFLEDDLEILEIIDEGFPRRLYERSNFINDMDNLTPFKRFRLKKETVIALLEEIEDQLEFPSDRNNIVSPINHILALLRFVATAGHLSSVADFIGMSNSTAFRTVEQVASVIARLSPQHVYMPQDQNESLEIQNNFFKMNSFPRILLVIDGTHIRMQSPGGEDPLVFINRKEYYSINVQVAGDPDLKIRDIVARWPGSAHDQTIFSNSRLQARFENNEFPNSDSGYALRNYILTPLLNPQTPGERLYNESHIRTRNCIEILIGVWKRRFPVFAYGIRLKLEPTMAIIVACAVLHNIAREQNEEEPPFDDYLIEMGDIEDLPEDNNNQLQNNISRNTIVN